jgi:molecular chaperone GrpE
MIFKKRKNMSDKKPNNNTPGNENTDNMSQAGEENEVLSNETENEDGAPENTLVESDEEKAKKLEGEIAELKDKYLRLTAEFDNFRRRTAKERVELTQTAGKDVIQSLLVVLDDMDRAGNQLETTTDIKVIKEGVSLVFNKLRSVLQQKGLKVMDAANKDFDADLHEAITEIPAASEDLKGKVSAVVESGYYLNDKLIRHAKVVVGK